MYILLKNYKALTIWHIDFWSKSLSFKEDWSVGYGLQFGRIGANPMQQIWLKKKNYEKESFINDTAVKKGG